jgi:phosphohistidine phosphatase
MKLYLMRHAHAAPGPPMNPTRDITDKGRAQAQLMGEFLKGHIGTVDLILCSSFRRAIETAEIVSKILGVRYVKVPALDPDGIGYKMWDAILQAVDRRKEILVISHDPAILELFAFLTGGSSSQVRFEHAAVCHIKVTAAGRDAVPAGCLHWFIEPKLIESKLVDQLIAERDVAEAAAEAALSLV